MPTVDSTQELAEGEFIFTEEDSVCEIVENTMEFNTREEEWKGSLRVSPKWSGQTKRYDAGFVKDLITANEIFLIPGDVVENPEEVLVSFAVEALDTVLNHVDPTLEYNGVEHVEQMGDVKAAAGLIEGEL
jgi:hypothetical protein